MEQFQEPIQTGMDYRRELLEQTEAVIERQYRKACDVRKQWFNPSTASLTTYQRDTDRFRRLFREMLGWPLTQEPPRGVPRATLLPVGRDEDGTFYRLRIETFEQLSMYAMLLIPHSRGPFPLVIDMHGGGGICEWEMGVVPGSGSVEYPRRFARRGCAVVAPQLLLWTNEERGPKFDRQILDDRLKQCGGSITALEIYQIQRCIDYLGTHPSIDTNRVAAVGCSYGGFYALYSAAVELRIKAVLCACYINSRYHYAWPDWTFHNAAARFFDPEVAALVCPRPLFAEVARNDAIFSFEHVIEQIQQIGRWYHELGVDERFVYREHTDSHSPSPNNAGIDFIVHHLG